MERNRRSNINRNIRREEEERIAQQQEEERENENAFRNDNRDFGFRRDSQRIRRDNTITMPLRRDPRLPLSQPEIPPPNISFTHRNSALGNYTDQYIAQNVGYTGGWNNFMRQARGDIIRELNQKRGSKVFFSITVKMSRSDGQFTTLAVKNIRIGEPKIITEGTDLEELYDEIMEDLNDQMDLLQDTEGSGWKFEELDKVDIHTVIYDPLNAGKWIPLPKHIADKKAVINIQNKNEECFKWCMARAISPIEKNPQMVDKNLREVAKSLNMKGIRSPTPIEDIKKFEEQNEDFAVVVLGLNEYNNVYPVRQSNYSYKRKHLVILLLIKDEEENFHYTLVNSSSRLLTKQHSNHNGKTFRCWNCLNIFRDKDKYIYHRDQCVNLQTQTLVMPKPGTYLKFKNHEHVRRYPFVIYADIESLTKKMEYCDMNPEVSYTTKIQKHEPISYTFTLVSFNQNVLENKTMILLERIVWRILL